MSIETDSVVIKDDEKVEAILEYAENKMILSLSTDMVLLRNWQVVKVLNKLSQGNFNKHYLMPAPEFDEKTFPFIISSGREFFNIINVRDYKMQALIHAPCINIRCQ